MEKMITFSNKLVAKIAPIRFQNSTTIQRKELFEWFRRLVAFAFIIGFAAVTFLAYSANSIHFWSLIKVGFILGLIGFVAFVQKSNTIKK